MYKTKCPCCGYKYFTECGETDGDNIGEINVNMSCSNCEVTIIITIYDTTKGVTNIEN